METVRHTLAGLAAEKSATIRYSGEQPAYQVQANPPGQGGISETVPTREDHLLHMVGELSARVIEQSRQISALLSENNDHEPIEIAAPLVDEETLVSAQPKEESKTPSLVDTSISSESTATSEINNGENSELSPAHARYEQAILFFLKQPNLRVECANAGGWVRQQLGFEKTDWNNMFSGMGGILKKHKKTPTATRSSAISLDMEALLRQAHKPFFTPQVQQLLKEAQSYETATRLSVEEGDNATPSAETATSNGMQQLRDGDEIQVNSSGAGRKVAAPPVSRRVAKALRREPNAVEGYKREPKGHDFLSHRRLRSGAMR
jgi:hypothetical protein